MNIMVNTNHIKSFMKFLCLAVISYFFISTPGFAQTSKEFAAKGAVELGGSFSYQHTEIILQDTDVYSYNTISFLPYIGYFIADNFEIGINPLGLQTSWNSQDQTTLVSIFICPSYNFKAADKIYPFAELQLGYTGQYVLHSLSALNTWYHGFSWGGRTGVKFSVVEKCLLNMGLQYQNITLTPSGEKNRSGSNIIMFSAGITFWL